MSEKRLAELASIRAARTVSLEPACIMQERLFELHDSLNGVPAAWPSQAQLFKVIEKLAKTPYYEGAAVEIPHMLLETRTYLGQVPPKKAEPALRKLEEAEEELACYVGAARLMRFDA